DTLMVRALDEPDAVYGQLAESVSVSDDGNAYTFYLRPEARFHDATPVTAEDVAFSVALAKEKGHPNLSQTIGDLEGAKALDDHTVVLNFNGNQSRQLPMIAAQLIPVFSKAYYSTVDFEASTLEPPLGSGPYRVGNFEPGRYIEYVRDRDYWGRDIPVNVGMFNFDVFRLEFFRDIQVAFEGFKSGVVRFHEEFSSKTWATEYNFPAVESGAVVKTTFADGRPAGAQGWFYNLRRDKFADPRTREALGLAFDFEWANKTLFYGLYGRTVSFFQNSEMVAEGNPSPGELALLEPWRGKVPDSVFGEPYSPPVTDGSGNIRSQLRQATKLLADAGWTRNAEGKLVDAGGRPFVLEFLSNSSAFERIVNPFIRNLAVLGVDAKFRLVDPAQFEARLNDFDFDIVGRRYSLSPTPGESIRQMWGSKAAETPGSSNIAGIADPAIDALTDIMIRAKSRADMVTAARALDRVLRAGQYWIPQWNRAFYTVAFWDEFGWPEILPAYDLPVEQIWWFDAEKAARLADKG
ncbi:MAG: ABC transporter substrate-binding protein, partial [Rhodobiaceae bacterium]|nr:ABC transporter substrate-binding protein [Rhodobiaceae bacterium]